MKYFPYVSSLLVRTFRPPFIPITPISNNNMQTTLDSAFKRRRSKAASADSQEEVKSLAKKAKLEEVKSPPPASSDGAPFTYEDWLSQINASWQGALSSYLEAGHLRNIYRWVSREYAENVCRPVPQEIFTAFKLAPFESVKVVIVGQDPYPGPNEAMGMSFSVHRNIKVPGSLRNIYKCLEQDPQLSFKAPKHGDLSKWASQGVFMLNAVLTVRQGKPNSHAKKGWESFTDEVIKQINNKGDHVVFMLWGSFAQQKAAGVEKKKHLVLEACHPSPLSASKGLFFSCRHFSRANEYLRQNGKTEIDWSLDN